VQNDGVAPPGWHAHDGMHEVLRDFNGGLALHGDPVHIDPSLLLHSTRTRLQSPDKTATFGFITT